MHITCCPNWNGLGVQRGLLAKLEAQHGFPDPGGSSKTTRYPETGLDIFSGAEGYTYITLRKNRAFAWKPHVVILLCVHHSRVGGLGVDVAKKSACCC